MILQFFQYYSNKFEAWEVNFRTLQSSRINLDYWSAWIAIIKWFDVVAQVNGRIIIDGRQDVLSCIKIYQIG